MEELCKAPLAQRWALVAGIFFLWSSVFDPLSAAGAQVERGLVCYNVSVFFLAKID